MVKPDYSREGIELYCADCLEVLPTIASFDLLLTDPPYPNLKGGTKVTFTSGVGDRRNTNKTVGTPWGGDLSALTLAFSKTTLGAMIFCSYHSIAHIPTIIPCEPKGLITWYQRNAMPPINNVPHFQTEFIWAFQKSVGLIWKSIKTMYDIPRLQSGCMATERICTRTGEVAHPAQKPIALIQHLLAVGGFTVCDPFLGSGTTAIACIRTGRKCIGIEKEPKYFDIAVARVEAELNQGDLFRQRNDA